MKKKIFLGSLALSVAALLNSGTASANVPDINADQIFKKSEIVQPLEKDFVLKKSNTSQQYAQHRSHYSHYSHSSHSSHSSHYSHYSSGW